MLKVLKFKCDDTNFFHHIIAINIVQISQDKRKFGKCVMNQISGFFLSFFDPFSASYSHSGIQFEFFEQFQSIKHFI